LPGRVGDPDRRGSVGGLGHLSNLEQPEEFNRVLLGFLDKVTGRSAL
jgi:pimeloyl-ACP methyl ester carboxylesterase